MPDFLPQIVQQKTIMEPYDVLELDIIDFNRLNGSFGNPANALRTITSWFAGHALATIFDVPDFSKAPKRDDWPGWKHIGSHEESGRDWWNYFFYRFPPEYGNTLIMSDAPDFHGTFSSGVYFWGDIGRVSASAFAMTQKQMRSNDVWISLFGERHVLIEPCLDISKHFQCHVIPLENRDGCPTCINRGWCVDSC